jgi:hypothetical protein
MHNVRLAPVPFCIALVNRCNKTNEVTKKPQLTDSRTPKKRAICKQLVRNTFLSAESVQPTFAGSAGYPA